MHERTPFAAAFEQKEIGSTRGNAGSSRGDSALMKKKKKNGTKDARRNEKGTVAKLSRLDERRGDDALPRATNSTTQRRRVLEARATKIISSEWKRVTEVVEPEARLIREERLFWFMDVLLESRGKKDSAKDRFSTSTTFVYTRVSDRRDRIDETAKSDQNEHGQPDPMAMVEERGPKGRKEESSDRRIENERAEEVGQAA
ncbi:hypothetical protein WN55_00888 [Dufourea novaeangliae]|uniref:Uncharacterized protein n=1 Tax=Dufourea novaeangliae TaxID=178035 RepID=A0A154PD20_DUFNO|nr:hypothetical protein WN55_00888 [Dufourea novaeangliae]